MGGDRTNAPAALGSAAGAFDIFISHAPEDEALVTQLEHHLALLERGGAIRTSHRGRIPAGAEPAAAVASWLGAARVILLCVSSDYLSSAEHEDVDVVRAMERHHAGDARVLPILLRPCDWQAAPFAALQPLPRNGVAISIAADRDAAWTSVARAVREAIGGHCVETEMKARPTYPDDTTRRLSQSLEDAYARKARLRAAGAGTAEIDGEILALKRQLREGGRLRAGDALGDGRYLLLEQVGRGGFAFVWKACDSERNATVAIKVLHANLAGDVERRNRFIRGARIMSELAHPAVVRVKDALCTLLAPVKKVETEKEVRPEAQRIDLYIAPAPEPGISPCPLGLLGQLLECPCNLEHFHDPPSTAKLVSCLRKHLNSSHALSLEDPALPPPMGWVLSAGRAKLAMEELGCRHARRWRRGIYIAARPASGRAAAHRAYITCSSPVLPPDIHPHDD